MDPGLQLTDTQLPHIEPFGIYLNRGDSGGSFVLRGSSHLSSFTVRDSEQRAVATVVGILLFDPDRDITFREDEICCDFPIVCDSDFEEKVLDHIVGRFVVLTNAPLSPRLYPDVGATIPIVYDADAHIAASSAWMLFEPGQYYERLQDDIFERHVKREAGGAWLTADLTAHKGVRRVLPNHFLDLVRWETVRFRPRLTNFSLELGIDEAAEEIGTLLSRYMATACRQFRLGVTLTAGFDTRLLLAATHGLTDKVRFFTFDFHRRSMDIHIAVRLSEVLGLNFDTVPVVHASRDEQTRWDQYVGHATREINRLIHPTMHLLDFDAIVTGMYGEIGRSRLYRQDFAKINNRKITADFVLSRLTLPKTSVFLSAVETWLSSLPGLPPSAILDLAFNELRFGSWAMAMQPIQSAIQLELMPFAQHGIQNAFMRVRPELKTTKALFRRCADFLWPDTLHVPVNKYGDYRDLTSKVHKIFDKGKLLRHVRDRFA